MNHQLETLSEYPFFHLNELLKRTKPKGDFPINLSIGEPKNTPPREALSLLNEYSELLSQYPTTKGTSELRESYVKYLNRRFDVINPVDPDKNVLPVSGTREGIFSFIQATLDTSKKNPTVVMPNPFYKIYEGATHLAGGKPYYVNSTEEGGFKPNFESISEKTWLDCQLLILCSPSNPTGYTMGKKEYLKVLELAEKYDFLVCSDECYIDLYPSSGEAPVGLIECCDLTNPGSRAVIFHSLSKRSNLAGLRSGFISANETVITKLLLYRTYHGATLSVPAQKASAWAWSNDAYVEDNRKNYDEKYAVALDQIDQKFNVTRPSGGFYFWIKLPVDDLTFTKELYQEHNVIVLPGSFLGVENKGQNPGSGFIRIAIVHDIETLRKAASCINKTLEYFSEDQ